MANVRTGDPAVDTFLKGYAPPVREIAVKAREAIFAVLPNATEKVYPGWKVIQYGSDAGMKHVFAAISPLRDRVNLGLANGAELPDPDRLLEGTGKGIRHVKLTSPQSAATPAVRALLEGALHASRTGN